MAAETIQIFLADGTTEGYREAYFMDFHARVLAFQRSLLDTDKDNELEALYQRIGLYILVSEIDEKNPVNQKIYIGQSVNLAERLRIHTLDRAKDFWAWTLVIVSKDEHFNSAHAEYVEGKLIALAKQASLVDVQNGTLPVGGKLSRPEKVFADKVIEKTQLLLAVLGFNFTRAFYTTSIPTITPEKLSQQYQKYRMVYMNTIIAQALETSPNNFIILKDSFARAEETPSLAGSNASRARQELRATGKLIQTDDGRLLFTENTAFTSRSLAASVVGGTSLNGHIYWKPV